MGKKALFQTHNRENLSFFSTLIFGIWLVIRKCPPPVLNRVKTIFLCNSYWLSKCKLFVYCHTAISSPYQFQSSQEQELWYPERSSKKGKFVDYSPYPTPLLLVSLQIWKDKWAACCPAPLSFSDQRHKLGDFVEKGPRRFQCKITSLSNPQWKQGSIYFLTFFISFIVLWFFLSACFILKWQHFHM